MVVTAAFLASCGTDDGPFVVTEGQRLRGSVTLHSEPDKKITWRHLDSCHTAVQAEGTTIAQSDAAAAEVDLREHSNTTVTVQVTSRVAQTLDPVVEYSFLGMAPGAVTVTRAVRLRAESR